MDQNSLLLTIQYSMIKYIKSIFMRQVRRKIKPIDKVYTVAEFIKLLRDNDYSYKFIPGEVHYANAKEIYATHLSGNGEMVASFVEENPELTHIVLLEQPEE